MVGLLFGRAKQPIRMTTKEMTSALYLPWYTDKEGHLITHYRQDVVMALVPTRFVPLEVLETSEKYLYDPLKVAKYVHSAFCIYRTSVGSLAEAPHTFRNSVLEWPQPADFLWSDMDSVLGARKLLEPEPIKVEISMQNGKYKQTTKLDVRTGEKEIKLSNVSDFDKLEEFMKYVVKDVHHIGCTGMQAWQLVSLRYHANYFASVADELTRGNRNKEQLENLPKVIQDLKDPKKIPAVYMKKKWNGPFRAEEEIRPDYMTLLFWNN